MLATLDAPYPSPPDSVGGLEGHIAGPAPSRRVPCGVCARTGRMLVAGNRPQASRYCPLCGGTGWRRRRKGESPYDEYTGEPVGDDASKPKHKAPFRLEDDYRKLTAQLERVDLAIAEREGVWEDSYGWEKARVLWDRMGSYNELRRSLGALEARWPIGHSVIRSYWLQDVPVRMIGRAHDVERVAVVWLALEMRGEVRVPPWMLEDRKIERKKGIAEYVAEGMTAGQIARAMGLPKKKIQRLLKSLPPAA